VGELKRINVAAGEVQADDIVIAVQDVNATQTLVKRISRDGSTLKYIGSQRHRPKVPYTIVVADFQRIDVLRWVP
jgi:hypothetical protein